MPKSSKKPKSKSTPKKRSLCTIGIDLGGTKVAAALVDASGKLIAEARRATVPPELAGQGPHAQGAKPTPAEVAKHVKYVVQAMVGATNELLEANPGCPVNGIGLASAGPMHIEKGTLDRPANFNGWKTVPLVKLLRAALQREGIEQPVSFQNDAIAAALGEGWIGRARGSRTYAMITVGTGIGSGVILNGRPAQSGGMGSEWGHMLVQTTGLAADVGANLGAFDSRSVESVASGTGLVRRARAAGLPCENAHELSELARGGDAKALALFSQASEALAVLFYNLSLGFHLEKIVISGGMLAVKDLFLPSATRLYVEMMKAKNPLFLAPVQVAKLGTKAGVIGAARLPML